MARQDTKHMFFSLSVLDIVLFSHITGLPFLLFQRYKNPQETVVNVASTSNRGETKLAASQLAADR